MYVLLFHDFRLTAKRIYRKGREGREGKKDYRGKGARAAEELI
jgi:hypothetical protein